MLHLDIFASCRIVHQWGLETYTWFDIASNVYFLFLNTLGILLNYRGNHSKWTRISLSLVFFLSSFYCSVLFQGIFTIKIIKNLLSDILWGLILDALGSFAEIFVLLPVYGFINNFSRIRLQFKRQPTPVFLPGESQGRGSLVGCRLWGHTESDATEVT